MLKVVLAACIGWALLVVPQETGKKTEDPLANLQCFMMPKKVNKDVSSDYHDGKVYFCCKKCKAGFDKDPAKFTVKANQQLVQTKQFVQKGCPLGGGEVDGTHKAKMGDVEVSFCCDKCLAKFNAAADDTAKAELVFSADSFEKGFEKTKPADDTKTK